MNFKKSRYALFSLLVFLGILFAQQVYAYQIFIYRPHLEKKTFFEEGKFFLHGEFFVYILYPSTFPSYNDHLGPEDRLNFGFQNLIFFTKKTALIAQLVTHDDGHRRTKFDWHFSLRHSVLENLVLIVGHDSHHDADYQSLRGKKPFFLNRNYLGFGLPFQFKNVYIEPFTWIFHHSNQVGHLDQSGNKLRQEFGLRIGIWSPEGLSLSLQMFFQTEKTFSLGQAFHADIILRFQLLQWLELSLGGGIWQDIQTSRLGNKQSYYKFIWGLAVPF